MRHLQRDFAVRTLLASVLLSILAGGVCLVIELDKLDRLAESVALAEGERFTRGGLGEATSDLADPGRLQVVTRSLVQDHCLVVQVFNSNGGLRATSENPRLPVPLQQLETGLKNFGRDGIPRVHRFRVEGRSLVQLHLPLRGADQNQSGYLEAVFLMDQETVNLLMEYTKRITLVAMFSVLASALILYPVFQGLNRRVFRVADEVVKGNLELAKVLGAAIAQRDSDTGEHNFRVALYAFRLVEALDVQARELRELDLRVLILGAFLHDVGKIGISDTLLLKPGKLTPEEFDVMKTHVNKGLAIIGHSGWLRLARRVVGCHHERFDGGGYPKGLKGRAIPLEARLFAVVDVFDALTSHRPYRTPMPIDQVLALLEKEAGGHFDPGLVATFTKIARRAYDEIGQASEVELEAMLAAVVQQNQNNLHDATPIRSLASGCGEADEMES